jgi:site-specific DNA recombinase
MKAVALYARVSSDQQTQQATVESQIAALRERALADGHNVLPTDLLVDDGYSGSTLVRPALERLRDRVAEGGVDRLYVHSPDRLARRYAYQVLLLEEFARCGTEVIFLSGPAARTAEDELLVQVQGMIAEYERAKIIERSRRGKLHKARRGLVNVLSAAPYGYLYVRKEDTEAARFHVVLHEAKVVQMIFGWFVDEQISMRQIARRLTAEKTASPSGKSRWSPSTVAWILNHPAYMGRAAYGRRESVPRSVSLLRPPRGRSSTPRSPTVSQRRRLPEQWISIAVPPIVSADRFAAAQEQLKRNRQLAPRNATAQRFLLQGLLGCARCGYAYSGKTAWGQTAGGRTRYLYYMCRGRAGYRFEDGAVCGAPHLRASELETAVWTSVRELLQDPARVLDEWCRRGTHESATRRLREQQEELTRAVTTQEKTLQRLVDAYEAGAIELDELHRRSDRVRQRIRRAQEDLEAVSAQLERVVELREVAGQLTAFANKVHSGLDRLSWQDRQQIIRTLLSRIDIDGERVTIVYRISARRDGGPVADGVGGAATPLAVASNARSLTRSRRRCCERS